MTTIVRHDLNCGLLRPRLTLVPRGFSTLRSRDEAALEHGAVLVAVLSMGCSEGVIGDSDSSKDIAQDVGIDKGDKPDLGVDESTQVDAEDTKDDQGVTPIDTSTDDTGTTGCTTGTTRCDGDGNVELCHNNEWIFGQSCSGGCAAGSCVAGATTGDCTTPIDVYLGTPVVGSTDSNSNPYTWSPTCDDLVGYSPTGPETIFKLEMISPQWVEINVKPIDAGYYGFYLRGECSNSSSELHDVCGANVQVNGTASVETLLGVGTHYIIVDDFQDSSYGPGEFILTVNTILNQSCLEQMPEILDLSDGMIVKDGAVGDALNHTTWLQDGEGCNSALDTTDGEVIYTFGLAEPQNVQVTLSPTAPVDGTFGIYLRPGCERGQSEQLACSYTIDGGDAVLEANLDAGAYWLFVDTFESSAGVRGDAYRLVINTSPAN